MDVDADGPCSDPVEVQSLRKTSTLLKMKASKKVVENGMNDNGVGEDGQDSTNPLNSESNSDDASKEVSDISGDESVSGEDKVTNGKSDEVHVAKGSPKVNGDMNEPIECDSGSDDIAEAEDRSAAKDDSKALSVDKSDNEEGKSDRDSSDSDDVKSSNGTEKEAKPEKQKDSDSDDVIDLGMKSDEKNDSEKENAQNRGKKYSEVGADAASSTSPVEKQMDTSNDDIQIIGESKVIHISSPSIPNSSSQNIILLPQMDSRNSSVSPGNNRFSMGSSSFGSNTPGMSSSPFSSGFQNMRQGFIMGGQGNSSQSPAMPMMPQPVSPPKPKSSLDQIELIRWEIQNRINTRPKYFKPNPTAELGPLAKFLFDIGSDLIKESVYHELVRIQSKKQDEDKLTTKEKEDLGKLKDIERDLNNIVGHLKFRMRKRCKHCHFQTESINVMYHHKQFPHEDNKHLLCAHCPFMTKQAMSFKFHIEAEHNVQPRLHDRKFFYECDLCQYDNNQEQKLNLHKQRCSKQFRPLFNLHPSCLSGAEINLCLENIFYKPLVPKNLKILQQKHLQQQAALAEARRQQAEVAALAAQKQQQAIVRRQRQPPPQPVSQFTPPINSRPHFQPRLQTSPNMSQVRFNSRSPVPPVRPTVASMLKEKQGSKVTTGFPHHGSAPVGFEVCEICGGYVKDRKALRIHFFYAHRIDLPLNLFDRNQPPLYCATCCVRFWTANGLRKHLDVHAQEKRVPEGFIGEGVSGKCIACGQLVGNIVVHMRVVHNREIHHYTNALMCMFCGASFNSHVNVERHVKDVHGTIDIATGAVKMKGKLKSSPPPLPKIVPPPKRPAPSNNSLVKGSVCVLCNLNFGRNVDLTRHCMRMHHTCMKCGMVVIDKSSLLKHTCLSSPSGTRDCTMCSETGFHPAYYVKHLRDKHLKKFVIDVARLSVKVIERWTKRSYPFKKVEEECVEISDSDDDMPVTQFKVRTPVTSPKKKARIGPASKINRPLLSNGVEISTESCDNENEISENEDDSTGNNSANSSPPGTDTAISKRKQSFDSPVSPDRPSKRRKQ